jgi:hypothetical protein
MEYYTVHSFRFQILSFLPSQQYGALTIFRKTSATYIDTVNDY